MAASVAKLNGGDSITTIKNYYFCEEYLYAAFQQNIHKVFYTNKEIYSKN